ncbi:MAG: NUDIX domain-containing protein, partial [Clostridiales bacterium]|nr:NUDIX domain-containing protein [Clostridiales bacterium]
MEYLDVLNPDGTPSGVIKERSAVHSDGDLHRTVHIWITRKNPETGEPQILLQKRSKNKDSHPSCLDISSAGHIEAGAGYTESALRELYEELGIKAEETDLKYLFMSRKYKKDIFYGKIFKDNQISRVYILKKDISISDLKLQKSEIETVIWQDYKYILTKLEKNDPNYCIVYE